MKITLQDIIGLSSAELSDLNRMVVGEIRRKRSIDSLQKATTINVGDVVTSSGDKYGTEFSIEKINRTKIVGKDLKTQRLWSIPISTLTVIRKHE